MSKAREDILKEWYRYHFDQRLQKWYDLTATNEIHEVIINCIQENKSNVVKLSKARHRRRRCHEVVVNGSDIRVIYDKSLQCLVTALPMPKTADSLKQEEQMREDIDTCSHLFEKIFYLYGPYVTNEAITHSRNRYLGIECTNKAVKSGWYCRGCLMPGYSHHYNCQYQPDKGVN